MKLTLLLGLLLTLNSAFAANCQKKCNEEFKSCLAEVEIENQKVNVAMSLLEYEVMDKESLPMLKKHYADLNAANKNECILDKKDCLNTCK